MFQVQTDTSVTLKFKNSQRTNRQTNLTYFFTLITLFSKALITLVFQIKKNA